MAKPVNTIKPQLIVEITGNTLWGSAKIKRSLIIDSASSLEALQKKMKKLVFDVEGLTVENFVVSYDLTSFFHNFSFINLAEVASKTGINYTLMRQYSSGIKFPSEKRVKKIEMAIREIGRELSKIKLHRSQKVA